jgi:hypothetical protein
MDREQLEEKQNKTTPRKTLNGSASVLFSLPFFVLPPPPPTTTTKKHKKT